MVLQLPYKKYFYRERECLLQQCQQVTVPVTDTDVSLVVLSIKRESRATQQNKHAGWSLPEERLFPSGKRAVRSRGDGPVAVADTRERGAT